MILALEKDLFFAVKMRDTLRHHGMEVRTVRTLEAFEQELRAANDAGGQGERPGLVIVNTATGGVDWETAIRKARAAGYAVLAFGSHMDLEARARAIDAGAQRVVANSKFTSDMPGLVKRMLSEPESSETPDASASAE